MRKKICFIHHTFFRMWNRKIRFEYFKTIFCSLFMFKIKCWNQFWRVRPTLLFKSIYIKMGVQMFVCLSVGMWRANGNPNPCTDLGEILHAHPHLSQGRFWYRFDPRPSPLGPGGPKTLKAEGHIFKVLSRLQINPGSARYLSYMKIIINRVNPVQENFLQKCKTFQFLSCPR